MSFRRAYALLIKLPVESSLRRELVGPVGQWTQSEHMLASVVDSLRIQNWMYGAMHRAENTPMPPRPKPLVRPGDPTPEEQAQQEADKPKFGTAAEQAQALSKMLTGLNA